MNQDLLSIAVCEISAGTYRIGHTHYPFASPEHTVRVDPFFIAKTTVTNAQFSLFIEAGGYHNKSYWSEMGWKWIQSKGDTQPTFWDNPNLNHLLQPIVGIGWYEAMAFVLWLRQATGKAWRLPTEVEWEISSRTLDGAKGFINSAEQGIGRTISAETSDNVSWYGAHHMLGNVWEWTSTRWGHNWQSLDYPYPYNPDDGRENLTGSHARVIRGGSWFDSIRDATPYNRARYLPGSRASNIGFRVALSHG